MSRKFGCFINARGPRDWVRGECVGWEDRRITSIEQGDSLQAVVANEVAIGPVESGSNSAKEAR